MAEVSRGCPQGLAREWWSSGSAKGLMRFPLLQKGGGWWRCHGGGWFWSSFVWLAVYCVIGFGDDFALLWRSWLLLPVPCPPFPFPCITYRPFWNVFATRDLNCNWFWTSSHIFWTVCIKFDGRYGARVNGKSIIIKDMQNLNVCFKIQSFSILHFWAKWHGHTVLYPDMVTLLQKKTSREVSVHNLLTHKVL